MLNNALKCFQFYIFSHIIIILNNPTGAPPPPHTHTHTQSHTQPWPLPGHALCNTWLHLGPTSSTTELLTCDQHFPPATDIVWETVSRSSRACLWMYMWTVGSKTGQKPIHSLVIRGFMPFVELSPTP